MTLYYRDIKTDKCVEVLDVVKIIFDNCGFCWLKKGSKRWSLYHYGFIVKIFE